MRIGGYTWNFRMTLFPRRLPTTIECIARFPARTSPFQKIHVTFRFYIYDPPKVCSMSHNRGRADWISKFWPPDTTSRRRETPIHRSFGSNGGTLERKSPSLDLPNRTQETLDWKTQHQIRPLTHIEPIDRFIEFTLLGQTNSLIHRHILPHCAIPSHLTKQNTPTAAASLDLSEHHETSRSFSSSEPLFIIFQILSATAEQL